MANLAEYVSKFLPELEYLLDKDLTITPNLEQSSLTVSYVGFYLGYFKGVKFENQKIEYIDDYEGVQRYTCTVQVDPDELHDCYYLVTEL